MKIREERGWQKHAQVGNGSFLADLRMYQRPDCRQAGGSGFDSRFLTGSLFIMQMRL